MKHMLRRLPINLQAQQSRHLLASPTRDMTLSTPPGRSSHAGSACTAPTLTFLSSFGTAIVVDFAGTRVVSLGWCESMMAKLDADDASDMVQHVEKTRRK